jgi:hypothetical protein
VSLSEDLSANMSQPLGLIPFFPNRPARLRSIAAEPARALGLMSFGVRFDLSANQIDLLRDALLHLPVGCKTSFSSSVSPHYSLIRRDYFSRTTGPAHRLYRNGRLLFTCADRREFLERFRSAIALYVAETSRRRMFVRAGVVGWGDRAILILGKSLSGKTTLVSRLVSVGATYYSDQFAVLDKRGLVYPYACPLQVRDDARQIHRLAEEFGGIAGCDPLPVGLVMVSQYKPGARWRPRRLSPAAGLSKILDHTVSAKKAPPIAPGPLAKIVSDAMVVQGARGEVSPMVEWLTARFGSPRAMPAEAKLLLATLRRTAAAPQESLD